jgi:perosamine synthetase
MTNIQAAIGLAQMETIEAALEDRTGAGEAVRRSHSRPLKDLLVLPETQAGMRHVYWMYTVFLAPRRRSAA